MDYNKILTRFRAIRSAPHKLLALVDDVTITQANTSSSQCILRPDGNVFNHVEGVVIKAGFAGLLPPGATDREIVDEVSVGGQTLAQILDAATTEQWNNVMNS